jgi:hypothetical protein
MNTLIRTGPIQGDTTVTIAIVTITIIITIVEGSQNLSSERGLGKSWVAAVAIL